MGNLKFRIVSIFLALVIAGSGFAQDAEVVTLGSLSEIYDYASTAGLDYRKALLSVQRAQQALTGIVKLDQSSVSISSSYTGSAAPGSSGLSYSGTINVPVLEQLSLSVKVDDSLTGDVGINLNPLSHGTGVQQSQIEYEKAVNTLQSVTFSSGISGVRLALNLLALEQRLATQQKATLLAEQKYNDEKIRYDKGSSSLESLNSLLRNWITARNNLLSVQQKYSQARQDFYALVASTPDRVVIASITLESLDAQLEELKARITADSADPARLASVRSSLLDVKSAQISKDAIWIFEPQLNINAGVSFGIDRNPSLRGGVSVSFSLDSWRADDIDMAAESLRQSEEQAESVMRNAGLSYQSAVTAVTVAENNSQTAKLMLSSTGDLLEETRLLYSRGKSSAAALQEAEISYAGAQTDVFETLAAEYLAVCDLLQYQEK